MTRSTKAKAKAKAAAPEAKTEAPAGPTPVQRPTTPEEAMQVQLAQQRGRAEVAVLKQRFAETDVAMTIAQAECAQLVQQNQSLQQENERLKAELAALTTDESGTEDNSSTELEDDQTTPAASSTRKNPSTKIATG